MSNLEICYNTNEDEDEPVIVATERIRGSPLKYRLYLDQETKKRKRPELVTEAQTQKCSCAYLLKYQASLKSLIKNKYEMMGYTRKSPPKDITNRTRLLRLMVANFWASSPLTSHDLDSDSQIIEDLQVDGNSQDLLTFFKPSKPDIFLVYIDFAGLEDKRTRYVEDFPLPPFRRRSHKSHKFYLSNFFLTRQFGDVTDDKNLLQKFENRNRFIQRSK
ncbi:hypothetical protein EDC94DRAFT_589307 [Helicostylum pulchrum]|nr:hypothetical protein EDC94DRAFT_589307 [Helicostylum pulchrum]